MKTIIIEITIQLLQVKLDYHKKEYDKTYLEIQQLENELEGLEK